jgi:hypothetical protein
VSWNDLVPLSFVPLLEVLAKNRTLKSLNLSWNSIIEKADQNNEFEFKVQSALLEYVQQRREAIEKGLAEINTGGGKKKSELDLPAFVIQSLS